MILMMIISKMIWVRGVTRYEYKQPAHWIGPPFNERNDDDNASDNDDDDDDGGDGGVGGEFHAMHTNRHRIGLDTRN